MSKKMSYGSYDFIFVWIVFTERIIVPCNVKSFPCDTYGSRCGVEWDKWKRGFQSWVDVNEIVDSTKKKAYLLYYGGDELREVFSSLPNDVPLSSGPLAAGYVNIYQATIFHRRRTSLSKECCSRTYNKWPMNELTCSTDGCAIKPSTAISVIRPRAT